MTDLKAADALGENAMALGGAPPTAADVAAARERLAGEAVRTPLLESDALNRLAGRRLLVKAECLQRTGSFKFRGAWNHLSANRAHAKKNGVVAFSSGNHAQGVAAAAAELGVDAVIVMPTDAPAAKLAGVRAYGAAIEFYDRAEAAKRDAIGARFVREQGRRLVRPYDDPYVIAGQGTAGLEIAEQAAERGVFEADALVCCGGGGLASGMALAFETAAPGLRVRPCEPEGFDDWRRSLESGSRCANEQNTGSICDAIMTPSPGALTWAIGARLFGPGLAVSDLEARRAMAVAAETLKLVVEPGGAVALAAALYRAETLRPGPVIVMISGGNVDMERHRAWTDPAGLASAD